MTAALKAGATYLFPQKRVERLCREQPHLRVRLFELLSQRLSTDGTRIAVPMNRQDIADYLSLTMETVSRTPSLLKAARIGSVPDSHQLELRNVDVLRALADGID